MRRVMLTVAVMLTLAGHTGVRAAGSEGVVYLPAAQVAGAFDKGQPLVERSGYKVHASRREGPGMAEVHVRDTDVIYVLQGSATIVTGGQVVDGHLIAVDEIRGTRVSGGTERALVKGDLFIVPNGVPHQFTRVAAPFTYYVVKPTSTTGDGGTR